MASTLTDPAETYANQLIHPAMRIVGAVHYETHQYITDAIADAVQLQPPADTDPVMALVVTLAAMVDPTRTASELLNWTLGAAEFRRLREAGVNERAAQVLAEQIGRAA